ncbi:MAG: hypothetical protein R3C60_00410 [Parvularculaceae bacterium]
MLDLLAILYLQAAGAGAAPATRTFDPYLLCVCPDIDRTKIVRFSGYVSDAQLTIAPDGKSVLDRQATIFESVKSASDLGDRVKLWHNIKPEKCGLSFDYGKRYEIVATKIDDRVETNACLMGKVRPSQLPKEK